MIKYSVEKIADIITDVKPLLEAHYKEIAWKQDRIKLNPNYRQYEALEQLGMLHISTVRIDGALVGYCITLLVKHMHYQDCLYALNDILYIAKLYRRGSLGSRLIKFTEEKLKELGALVVTYHVKTSHDFRPLLERNGYELAEWNLMKYIGGN